MVVTIEPLNFCFPIRRQKGVDTLHHERVATSKETTLTELFNLWNTMTVLSTCHMYINYHAYVYELHSCPLINIQYNIYKRRMHVATIGKDIYSDGRLRACHGKSKLILSDYVLFHKLQ